ncbi:MAG: hypothetical protein ACYDG2_23110, partial [Ruminiclostridium sp.]
MMYDTLFHYTGLQKILLNTFLVSFPEEIFLIMFTLILVGEFEYWKEPECKRLINRFDYVRVFLPAIVCALISNTLRYYGLSSGIFQFLPFIIMYILIVFTNDIFGDASALKWMVKTFIYFALGFLIIGLIEFIYIPFLLYSTDMTLPEMNNNFILYFTLALPVRLLQFSIILYFVCRKRTLLKGKLLMPILSNPILSVIFSSLLLINILFLELVYRAIFFDGILVTISPTSLSLILTGVVLFPMLNISGLLWGFYHLRDKETKDKKTATDKLDILLNKIELYTIIGDCD